MIGLTSNTRIFLCTDDTDMRKSFNSLSGIIRRAMNLDPFSGYLFIFKNKRADRIKALYWDEDGMAIWYKCLQRGTYQFPDLRNFASAGLEIDSATLNLILDGIDLSSIRRQRRFRIDQPPVRRPRPEPVNITIAPPLPQDENFEGDHP